MTLNIILTSIAAFLTLHAIWQSLGRQVGGIFQEHKNNTLEFCPPSCLLHCGLADECLGMPHVPPDIIMGTTNDTLYVPPVEKY